MLIVCLHLLCFMMHIFIEINIKAVHIFMKIRIKGDILAELGILQHGRNSLNAFP